MIHYTFCRGRFASICIIYGLDQNGLTSLLIKILDSWYYYDPEPERSTLNMVDKLEPSLCYQEKQLGIMNLWPLPIEVLGDIKTMECSENGQTDRKLPGLSSTAWTGNMPKLNTAGVGILKRNPWLVRVVLFPSARKRYLYKLRPRVIRDSCRRSHLIDI